MSDSPATPAARFRAAALLLGAAGTSLLASWAWLLGREGGRFVLAQDAWVIAELPAWLVLAAVAGAAIGLVGALLALAADRRLRDALCWCGSWMRCHPVWSALLAIAVLIGAVDVYDLLYDPIEHRARLGLWMVRQDMQGWLYLGAALLAALSISAWRPARDALSPIVRSVTRGLRRTGTARRWGMIAVLAPGVLGAAMAALALEAIPHFSDALTYLTQGRMLFAGMMYCDTPSDPLLLRGSLFFLDVDGRFFGKYPIGWPAIVGAFDRLRIGFAANAALAMAAVALTWALARQIAPRRIALLAAVLMGLSPWTWFNGANFASHVGSTCAVTGFLWLLLLTDRRGRAATALGAGLCLGAAVLIRPFDAAMFALPAVVLVVIRLCVGPRRWWLLGPLVAVGAMVGVAVYLWQNTVTTGAPLTSPYALEARWATDWERSPVETIGRVAYQWVELNARFPGWGIGGLTVAIMGAIAAGPRWRSTPLRVVAASSILFFLGCAAFGFTTVWWGPRWLMPIVPLLAILAAELVWRMLVAARSASRASAPAAQAGLCLLAAGLVLGPVAVYAGLFHQHRLMPPHTVSAAAHRRALAMGLDNAIVAMPLRGDRPPFDARAGIAHMKAPWPANPVIYVRAIADWQVHARRTFPGRDLYELRPDPADPEGFGIAPPGQP